MTKHEVTWEYGLTIQARSLAKWEKLLKPEVYARIKAQLEQLTVKIEKETRDKAPETRGFLVPRGKTILEFVLNYQSPK